MENEAGICVCVCVRGETGMYLQGEMCVSESVGRQWDVEGEKLGCGERSNLGFYVYTEIGVCACVCVEIGGLVWGRNRACVCMCACVCRD